MNPRDNVLGVARNAINMNHALETIHYWIERRELHYICVTPAHSIMAAQTHRRALDSCHAGE